MNSLSTILQKFYVDNSRFEIVPPARTIKELESGRFVISDFEIADEEIPIIVRFLKTKQAQKYITSIEVNKTSGNKVNKRRTNSALNANGAKFFRDLIHFFQCCKSLESLIFDSVEISPVMASSMCRALAENCEGLRWLMFKDCDINSDNGIKAMAPYLGRMQLQVLGLECCDLTDGSFPFLCSFLKAQECNSDALYWNATLRTDPYLSDKQRIRDDTQFVYSRGLVALSLFGNKITGEEMASFNEIISKNYWLLGLNLAENKLTEENLDNFVESVKKNDVIQAVLLRNNPGLTADNCLDLYKSVFAKMQLSDDLGSNGFARINLLGPTVSWMVKSWMRLQCEETRDLISVSSPSSRPDGSSNFDKSLASVSTYGNVGGGMVSRSPRRQQEVERKILFEEAKEYSVVAYTEPKGAQVFRFDNTSISNSNGRATLNSRLDSKAVPNDFEPVPELAEPENDQTWDTYVPVPSPPTEQQRNKSSNRKIASTIAQESTGDGEFLGFWPDEYVPRNADLRRPPSRISIRPRTALAISTDDEGDKPNISTQLSASGRRSVSAKSQLMSGRHSQSMQDAYNIKDVDLISNQRYIPHYLLANNKDIPVVENGVDRRLRSSSSDAGHLRGSVSRSQQLSRTKSPPWRPPSSHHHPSDHKPVPQVPLTKNDAVFPRESISTDRSRLYRQDVRNTEVLHFRPPRSNRPVEDRERTLLKKKATKKASTKTSKKDKLSKKGKVPSSEVESYRKMSESVVKATKRLEKASEKLLTVVESLSESAMLNINQSHLSTVSGSKVQARRHLQEESAKSSRGHTADINTSHLSNGSSIEDVALEELVRARLNFNLRKTLNDALLHGAN